MRRSASRRPTQGREARKSPCQHSSHNYQANVPGGRRANEIAGAGLRALHPRRPSTPLTYHKRISAGPYRWLRHPSYAGQWLEMAGIGLATGNIASIATCALVPLIGITARINGEERELAASLPGYRDYIQGRPRLIPHIW